MAFNKDGWKRPEPNLTLNSADQKSDNLTDEELLELYQEELRNLDNDLDRLENIDKRISSRLSKVRKNIKRN